jgi:hypothetical protein
MRLEVAQVRRTGSGRGGTSEFGVGPDAVAILQQQPGLEQPRLPVPGLALQGIGQCDPRLARPPFSPGRGASLILLLRRLGELPEQAGRRRHRVRPSHRPSFQRKLESPSFVRPVFSGKN